jgi:signal transduction histidine kinase
VIGKSILILIPPDRYDEETEILKKINSGKRVERFETVRVAKDGRLIDVSLIVSPIRGPNGEVVGASKILHDITQQKRLEAERDALLVREKEARERAEAAGRAKDEFLGLLSHELRTPLNSILGWIRLLTNSAEEFDKETLSRAIETIERSAKLQAHLIDDMLDISRIISGKLKLDAQPVDLTTVINAAIDALRPAADAKGIRIYITLDFGAETVLGDPVRLQQVVWNLLSNAIKFTPKGGSVVVTLQRVDSHFEITVSDSGIGIDEEFLPFVFDRFRQADSTTSKTFGGLGLGLSIVRQLVELHGGTVEAANRKDGAGAVFTVKIPVMAVRRQAETSVAEPESVRRIASENLAWDSSLRLDGVKILAVDDEPDARHLLTVLLEQFGAVVKTADSAQNALQVLEEFEPDVLVSDIGLPEEDGYSLIRKIREAEKVTEKRLPAIALTAFARTEDRYRALAAGYNMHVPKPVEPAELALVISRLVT